MKTAFHWFLAAGMLITGSINTISTKIADDVTDKGRPGYPEHSFDHPFVQALGMFIGEFTCLVVFTFLVKNATRRDLIEGIHGTPRARAPKIATAGPDFRRRILALPALCDMSATSCMYLGLTMTYASVFQMLRGSVVIFTGIMSVLFLKRKLHGFHWLGMILVLVGTLLVGASSIMGTHHHSQAASNPMLGNILIVAAQVIVSIQVVVEEKFVSGHNLPALQVVGWEGFWGMSMLSCVLVAMYFIPFASNETGRLEDAYDAVIQIGNSGVLIAAILGNIASIAFFNWFGISVTKHMSAATRMVLDSVRTLVVWGYDLIVPPRQEFAWLQLAGFVVLLFGTIVCECLFGSVRVRLLDIAACHHGLDVAPLLIRVHLHVA